MRFRINFARAIEHAVHNISVGWAVGQCAATLQSRLLILGLAASLQIKQRSRWRRSSVGVRARIGGREFRVFLATSTDLEVLNEIVVRKELERLPCAHADVIVDLGAHIGLATLRLLAAHPAARVIAVEPDPHLFRQLRDNVAGLPVTAVNAAITERPGPAVFYQSDVFAWANSLHRTMPQQSPIVVEGITLDDLLDRERVARVNLLKVDIEGAEWDLFSSGVPARVDAVIGEIHARDGQHPRELLDALAADLALVTGREDSRCMLFRGVRIRRQPQQIQRAPRCEK